MYYFLLAIFLIGTYYLALFLFFKKNIASTAPKKGDRHWMPVNKVSMNQFPPQLIDRPGMEGEETITATFQKEKEPEVSTLEMVEDEESVLLKAAEIVVEKIQDTINHVASMPPNPEEVYSKIKSIVNQYQIFKQTEYFDAINSFIAISVERDCSLQFSKQQLLDLWK